MNNFEKILNEIEEVSKQKKKVEMADILYESFIKLSDKDKEEYKKENNKYIAENKKANIFNEDIILKKAFLRHNARCVLFEGIKETLVELINKYKNKPFGEKTRQKFENEFLERTNCYIYIYKRYSSSDITISPKNHIRTYDLEIWFRDNDGRLFNIFEDNRLKEINIDMLECNHNKDVFIKDIEQRIVAYKESYIKMYQTQQFLEKHIDEHNKLCVDGLDTIYNKNHIYKKYCEV